MELRLSRWGHPGLSVLALKPRTSILNRDTQMGHHREKNHGEGCMGMETETEVRQRLKWCGHKSRDAWSHQKLERQENILLQSLQRRIWPRQHLNFGHLASRTVTEWISLILTNKFVVTCFGNPRKWIHPFVAFQSPSHVWLFANLWTAAWKASLSLTISQSLATFMSFASVMPSSHPAISSSDSLFSFFPQSFPASGTFPMSQLFTSDDQNTEASTSASVLPASIQGWFSLRLTGLISLLSKGLSGVFSSTTVWRHLFFGALPSLWSSFHNHMWPLERS